MLLANLAAALLELGRLPEARDCAERAYARARRAGDQVVVGQSLSRRVTVYRRLGDLTRAEETLSELEPRWKRMPSGHRGPCGARVALVAPGPGAGEPPSRDRRRGSGRGARRGERSGPEYLPILLVRRSELELRLKRPEEARSDAARALRMQQEAAGPGALSCGLGRAYLALCRALRALGKLDEAGAAATSALEHLEPSLGTDHPETREARRSASGS